MSHRETAALVARGLLVLFVSVAPASAQEEASVQALRRWAGAVVDHQPGSPDAAAAFTASLTYAHRVQLNPAMELFIKVLRGDVVGTARDGAQRQIFDLHAALRQNPGIEPFIRRAAILHADAAIFARRLPPPDEAGPPVAVKGRQPPSALLSARREVTQMDGRVVGQALGDWNWPFARSLVDLLLPPVSRLVIPDPGFAAAWYHAADAYLMASGNLAELRPQLQRAEAVLPDDPRLLFDRACYAESFGLASMQALRDDPALGRARGVDVHLPSEATANAEAQGLFRRAIAADPNYNEARVRLARLLEASGRLEEAGAEAARALTNDPDPPVSYLAHLVAGRAASAAGHSSEALAHYTSALALFPDAQSALLGASQAALMGSDVGAAVSFAQRLSGRSQAPSADPWWSYRLGAGRDAAALMSALWSRTSGGGPR